MTTVRSFDRYKPLQVLGISINKRQRFWRLRDKYRRGATLEKLRFSAPKI